MTVSVDMRTNTSLGLVIIAHRNVAPSCAIRAGKSGSGIVFNLGIEVKIVNTSGDSRVRTKLERPKSWIPDLRTENVIPCY